MKTSKSSPKLSDIVLPEDYTLEEQGITQSLLANFMSCRMRFLLAVNRWVPREGNKNVDFGSLFHEMLDKSYHQAEPPKYKRIGKWIDTYLIEQQESINSSEQEQERMAAVCHVLLDEYCRHYSKDWETRKFTEIEQVFSVPYDEVRLRGKIDGGYKLHKDKIKQWLMEHKTKGKIDEDFLKLMLTFDFQNLFYITAKEVGWKVNIHGVLYNVVRNPGMQVKQTESLEEFAQRLRAEIRKNPLHFFKRYEIPYTEYDKKLFRRELSSKLDDLRAFLAGSLKLYRNQHACLTPYRCQYLNACSSGSLAGYKQRPELFPELGGNNG